MVRVRIKRQFCNYSSCTILQFLELITQVATQTVPNRAAIIEIWHNQSVINLKGSFFRNKGSHAFEAPIHVAEDTFFEECVLHWCEGFSQEGC